MTRRLPTLTDVARHAGVSYATADRVLNGRGKVAEKSASRVRAAIEELGYRRNIAAANLSTRRSYRFVFVLPDGTNSFFATMREALKGMTEKLGRESIHVQIDLVNAFDPDALCDHLGQLRDVDGVALVGIEGAPVQLAVNRLVAQGVGVVTLVSDVPGANAAAYVGIDNRVAGQTAGRMIALACRAQGGAVLPIVGDLAARDHRERLAGLRDVLDSVPGLELCPELAGLDQHERVETLLRNALAQRSDIRAIYSLGAGNSGLIRVLRSRLGPRPMVVLHELPAKTRKAVEDGLVDVVIDQRPEDEITKALVALRTLADRQALPPVAPLMPSLYVKENLPPKAVSGGDQIHDKLLQRHSASRF